jgi:hypothetical protein
MLWYTHGLLLLLLCPIVVASSSLAPGIALTVTVTV